MKFHSRSRAGFTLLEMLVAVLILGLTLSLFTPSLTRRSDAMRLEQAAREVTDMLRSARSRAILNNSSVDVSVDVERRSFAVNASPILQLPGDFGVEMRFAETLRQQAGTGKLRFYPDGSSSGGEIRLKLTGHAVGITISWVTGLAGMAP